MVDGRVFIQEEALKRPNYFPGKMLTTEDLLAEQEYFLAKLRRHNRYQHGWGVVHGFDVSIRGEMVFIEPGYAIDCAGNEILLKEQMDLRLPPSKRMHFVVAEYCEEMANPFPFLSTDCATDQQEWAYIREVSQVEIRDVALDADHDENGPGTPGCGCQHAVTIACLEQGARGWSVSLRSRR